MAVAIHSGGYGSVVAVGVAGWVAFTMFRANLVVWVASITAIVLFIINVITPDTAGTVGFRFVDTVIGGAIALAAYALWPTWAETDVEVSLSELARAEQDYADRVLGELAGQIPADDQLLRPLTRRVRLAASNAGAAVDHSMADPTAHRVNAERALMTLEGFKRVSESLHGLRSDLNVGHQSISAPQATELRGTADEALTRIVAALSAGRPIQDLPRLERLTGQALGSHGHQGDPSWTAGLLEADEMVDVLSAVSRQLRLGLRRA